jgi:hypothetical protein
MALVVLLAVLGVVAVLAEEMVEVQTQRQVGVSHTNLYLVEVGLVEPTLLSLDQAVLAQSASSGPAQLVYSHQLT